MGLKPGYKQTEVGVIPEDWDVVTLGEACTFEDGDRGDNYPSAEAYVLNGNPFVNAGHLSDGRIRLDEMNFISAERFERLGSGKFKTGDILFCLRGSLGKFGIVGPEIGEGAIASSLIIVRSKPSIIGNRFLLFYLQSYCCSQMIKKWAGGAAQPNLGAQDLARFAMPYPPTRTEQGRISEALSDADALIESLEKLLAKKRDLKQGAMQELLTGKKRLPGFSVKWGSKIFGEIAQTRKQRIDPRKSGPYEFCVELEHIEQGTGHLAGYASTSKESSLKSVFQKNDVLFGKLRAYLRKYWLADREVVCSTEIWVLTANISFLTPSFLFQIVRMDRFINAASEAYGTHMPRSDWNVVKNYEVLLPPIEEQTAIAVVLSDMDTEITTLEAKLAKALQLKQGMMQELLTGRIRLA